MDIVMGHAAGVVAQAVAGRLTIPPPVKCNVFRRKRRS